MQCLATRNMRQAAAVRPSISGRRSAIVVRAENPYHDRNAVNPKSKGATKDANLLKQDKEEQFQMQQERLEWRRKHQHGGDDTMDGRDHAPHVNFPSKDTHGASAEYRAKTAGDRSDHPAPKDDLASASNPIGNLIRKVTGGEPTKE